MARFLRETITASGASVPKGLAAVAQKTQVPAGTLRYILDGRRWPGIEIVARIEMAYRTDIVGYSAMLRRRDRLQSEATP